MKNPLTFILLLALSGACVSADDTFDLKAALMSLQSKGEKSLKVPAGTYRLPEAGLALSGLDTVTLDLTGVTLVATSFDRPALNLVDCRNVTIKGLTVDYDPLPFTQGSVTAVNREARTVEFAVHEGYPSLTGPYLVTRFHLFEKDKHRWKTDAPDYYVAKTERIDDRHGRFVFGPDSPGLDRIEVGDRVALNIREAPAISISSGTSGTVMEDCTIHASPGLGVIIRFAEDSGTYRRLKILPGPRPAGATEPRLLSTCADGLNAAYTRRGPVLEECEFAYMGDDSLNVHGTILPVLEVYEDGSFLSVRPQKGEVFDLVVKPGDDLHFLQAPTYAITSRSKIASFERVAGDSDQWRAQARKIWPTFGSKGEMTFFRVRLQSPSGEARPGMFFEIPATAAGGYVVRGCYFHDHRARGLRLMGGNGLVEKNRFERIKGVAISIGPSFAFWREAGWCSNVTIRQNEIRNVGEGTNLRWPDSYTVGAISVIARVDPTPGGKIDYFPGNEGILIEGNTIDGCSVGAIQICAAKDTTVKDNIIRNVCLAHAPDAGRDYGLLSGRPIDVTQAEAELDNNQLPPTQP